MKTLQEIQGVISNIIKRDVKIQHLGNVISFVSDDLAVLCGDELSKIVDIFFFSYDGLIHYHTKILTKDHVDQIFECNNLKLSLLFYNQASLAQEDMLEYTMMYFS